MQRITGSDGIVRNRTTFTLRNLNNQLLSVFTMNAGSAPLQWKEDEIWRGSALLARRTPSALTHYALDHLGSPRAITNASGALIGTQQFSPFGAGVTSNSGALQFTAHERDAANLLGGTESMPDYMHARYYDVDGGRFLSVDPVLDTAKALTKPQTWNRYTYADNNPVLKVDPNGRQAVVPAPAPGPVLLLSAAANHAYQMETNEEYRLAAVAHVQRTIELTTFAFAVLGNIYSTTTGMLPDLQALRNREILLKSAATDRDQMRSMGRSRKTIHRRLRHRTTLNSHRSTRPSKIPKKKDFLRNWPTGWRICWSSFSNDGGTHR